MAGQEVSLDLLLLKYATLQRYKLEDCQAKRETTETLYGCATAKLRKISGEEASNRVQIHEGLTTTLKRIFDALLAEGQGENIPATAPQELASMALDLLRRAENLDEKKFLNFDNVVEYSRATAYRTGATALAAFTLESADMLRDALKSTTGNVTTSQPVTAARPIQLKAPQS